VTGEVPIALTSLARFPAAIPLLCLRFATPRASPASPSANVVLSHDAEKKREE
jgi:hypothetical protein